MIASAIARCCGLNSYPAREESAPSSEKIGFSGLSSCCIGLVVQKRVEHAGKMILSQENHSSAKNRPSRLPDVYPYALLDVDRSSSSIKTSEAEYPTAS
jgi:hypothetical protein